MGSVSARISAAVRPFRVTVAARYSPLGVLTFSSLPTSTPTFLANACAAGVGCPSLYATCADGPVHLLGNVRLRGGNAGSENGQPARRVEMRNRSRRFEAARAATACSTARAVRAKRRRSSAPGFLRIRFRVESQASGSSSMFSKLQQSDVSRHKELRSANRIPL